MAIDLNGNLEKLGLKEQWFVGAFGELVEDLGGAELKNTHRRGRRSARTVLLRWALNKVHQWAPIGVNEVAGLSSRCPIRDAALALTAALLDLLEQCYGPYPSQPVVAPPTPEGLKILCAEALGGESDREWIDQHGLDVPARFPQRATYFAYECRLVMFGAEVWYYISTNRSRSHWVVWTRDEDPEAYRYRLAPLCVCPKAGLERGLAALYMLRDWWQQTRDVWEMERPNVELDCSGPIDPGHFWALTDEIWPPEEEEEDERYAKSST